LIKRRFLINFPAERSQKPLTYHLIKDFDWRINILRATITEGKEGRLLIEVEAKKQDMERGISFLEEEKVSVNPMEKQLYIDMDKCIHCGACTATCFSEALFLDKETWELTFDKSKCVVCGLCAKACPIGIIKLGF